MARRLLYVDVQVRAVGDRHSGRYVTEYKWAGRPLIRNACALGAKNLTREDLHRFNGQNVGDATLLRNSCLEALVRLVLLSTGIMPKPEF